MKRGRLLNSELSYCVAKLGHNDMLAIADSGLPIPGTTPRIDLALCPGTPSFLETCATVFSEVQVESLIVAEEFAAKSPTLYESFIQLVKAQEATQGHPINISYLSHELFKANTHGAAAVVRTGEFTPYANVIIKAGVVF
ncbi:D-ribose pyranase [Zooshikella ganghwensis]|uniref:D-ribose pyranase n=1 Tax=Zooshikella ganghwensis TaxID=202772 RepID=A0A4P9VW70_9GAMM|nr:D-ribose pyranase [Zooshikella ganghwensis]RDH46654.1 D-ribose pyranase [Zooshikella ganghwensis]